MLYVLYSTQTCKQNWNKAFYTQGHDTHDISLESRARSQGDPAYEKMLDPTEGSPATGKSVAGILELLVDDILGTGRTEMEQRVLGRLRKDFQVVSEGWNDVLFTGQRIRWMKDPQSGPSIEVSQERAIEELEEIPVEKSTKEKLHCTPAVQTRYRSLLGPINCLQSRTQFRLLIRVFKMRFKGSLSNNWWGESSEQAGETTQVAASGTSILATHRAVENNWISWCLLQKQWRWVFTEMHGIKKKKKQNCESIRPRTEWLLEVLLIYVSHIAVFLAVCESIPRRMECHMEVLLTTNVKRLRELLSQHSLQNFFIHEMFWLMPVPPWIVDGFDRWSCRYSHEDWREEPGDQQQEQFTRKTIHMISMLRKDACSGSIHDLAHISIQNCLADCWPKSSAKANNLITTVKKKSLLEVDVHPNFRTFMERKAFLFTWCRTFLHTRENVVFFLNTLKIFSFTSSTRRTIPCYDCWNFHGFWESRFYEFNVCIHRLTHLFIHEWWHCTCALLL